MAAKWLDGKALAATLRQEIAANVKKHIQAGHTQPGLAVILVGDNEASQAYVRNKRKACADVGIHSRLDHLPATTSEADLLKLIADLNADSTIHGILVQLPLPPQIREEAVVHAVGGLKDVDAFHPENVGLLMVGQPRYYPCTPHGCIQLLRRNGIETAGREVVIVGRSNIVGKPLAVMMMQKPSTLNPASCDATVTIAHTRTANLVEVCRRADILIAAVGKAGIITQEMVRPGAVVLDVGTNSVNGKLVGDVATNVAEVASAMSPVPGGIGPMTIAMLLENTLQAAKLQATSKN
ncbi:MAG: bifunctional 5,10-methylenetetrahydrofolate dehydrogenase/5,10-methenyltetrahydrofolate cyclohydrolase [Fimbriiglobus sp.]